MKNISNFINEKLKVRTNTIELPTWKEFAEVLDYFPGKKVVLSDFCEEFKNAEIKDFPTFVGGDKERYPESGHIMQLQGTYNTKIDQSIIIYFKYERVPDNFITVKMFANEYKVLVDSLGEDLYLEIYNKLKEYYGK
jgi:hypothetical protein